jgi:quinoprotein dehydrogenase-associated probable ABC transporter substrate-binding protein
MKRNAWDSKSMRTSFAHGAGALALASALLSALPAQAQETSTMVDKTALRVCADPADMPHSNKALEGFENKIAEVLAKDLGVPVKYTWYPQATGFVRNTLSAGKCDVVIGYPQGNDEVQTTNPYYKSAWTLITKKGSPLSDVKSLDDPRLKEAKIGIVAGAPPATAMALNGLLAHSHSYSLMEDRRYSSAPDKMMQDLKAGTIDAGILWGPQAAYIAKKNGVDVSIIPLVSETKGPRLAFYITMGVRAHDQDWKRQLNALLAKHKDEINQILLSYGVPLLDEQNHPIAH